MTPAEFLNECSRTDHQTYIEVMNRVNNQEVAALSHYTLGLGTEAGELQNELKRYVAYGVPLDQLKIKAELGDCLYYMARICSLYGWDLEEVMQTNVNKLRTRYPVGFDPAKAINRDLKAETSAMSKETKNG